MHQYHFVTQWFFTSDIEPVWNTIIDIQAWPSWWSSWKQANIQGEENKLQLGSVVDHQVQGFLPYSLYFTTKVTIFSPPNLMELESKGTLIGRGKWVLESSNDGTIVTYYWDVGTSNLVLNWLGSLPFMRKLLEKNHNYIMEQGYQGLKVIVE